MSQKSSLQVVDEKCIGYPSESSDNEPPQSTAAEVIRVADLDPVLSKKMAAVNDAIDEIGLTPYHWKLFCLNGFGYAADSVSLREESMCST